MQIAIIIAAVAIPVALILLVIVVLRCCCSKTGRKSTETMKLSNTEAITNLHLGYENRYKNAASIHDLDNKRKLSSFYVLHRELSKKAYFNWVDHPSLVSEAVEHGWSRFAFNGFNISSPSTRSKLLSLCVSGDQVRENGADISWEISLGSAEFMQKVRLNSGMKKSSLVETPPLGVSCVSQTALPLPGPFLGDASFPQEAYFEITVVSSRESESRKLERIKSEGEKTKLIKEKADMKAISDEVRIPVKEDRREEPVPMAVGFSVGGSHPRRLPGSYAGSVGFTSDCSIYLDGIKMVSETSKDFEWGTPDRVIGCGFDPNQKQVFFTLDSELVHVIQCKSNDFSRPLYPTLAANIDITVLVNLGQSTFKYAPANVHRTPNPCFIGSNGHTAELGYDDSKELFSFSMGRLDAEWMNRNTTRSNGSVNSRVEIDEESEADLFEIVLERMNRSPSAPS
ncbi:hypothetical protein ACHQM5_023919 [Ranunculus cassubicifolius]